MSLMLLGVKCAFLHGSMRRKRFGDGQTMGRLKKAMYSTRDAPHTKAGAVREEILGLGFCASGLHPSVCWHALRRITVVA